MPDKLGTPFTILGSEPEEAETAITLSVNFTTIKLESLRYRSFHFRYGTSCFSIDICANSMATMHNEGAFVHPSL